MEWPASDPLVTGVGGTYLCTDANNTSTRTVDSVDPPAKCRSFPGAAEVGWTFAGGGFSHLFGRPDYQNTRPAGSTPIGAMRGVPGGAAGQRHDRRRGLHLAAARRPERPALRGCRPELLHIRTRRRSPGQNGVRERAFGSLKYEHLYRMEIETLQDLAREADAYRKVFNHVRPHEALAFHRPIEVHRNPPLKPATKITKSQPSRQES